MSTLTAIVRESSYLQLTPQSISSHFRIPPLGSILLILAYFGFVLALEFTNNDYPGAQHDQALGVRAAWLAVAQIPLLVLLAAKTSIVGLLTGVSYERLNVYHRWVARGLLMLSAMHFGFQSRGWDHYGLMQMEWNTDECPPTGIAAFALVLWMNLSTLAPFRKMSYKIFVVQHIITIIGLIVALMEHLPSTALYSRTYVWIAIGLYLFDRGFRTLSYLWTNMSPTRAQVEALDGAAVKLRLSSKHIKTWLPGSHVRLRFPRYGLWHNHPATIMSTPASHGGDLVFILRARGWLTKLLLKHSQAVSYSTVVPNPITLVGGPYRSAHYDFKAFSTVILVAGGSGVTFTMPILLDLAAQATQRKIPLRAVNFIWVIQHAHWISWVDDELRSASQTLHDAGIEMKVQIYVTKEQIPGHGRLSLVSDSSEGPSDSSKVPNTDMIEKKQFVAGSKSSPIVSYEVGRPHIHDLLLESIVVAQGETAIATCGPLGLTTAVRTAVVKISDDRAVHKGTGAQGIYLHVANVDYS